jgi:hypothetical protein
MRLSFIAPFVLPIVIAASSVSFATTPAPVPGLQKTAAESGSVDEKTYTQAQKPRMAQWRQDIDEFDDRVETKTTRAGKAAKLELASAWGSVERASAALGATSGDEWSAAKASYERAVNSLEATWTKFDSKKK